jgi:hypothetical protein
MSTETDETPIARLIYALRSPFPEGFEWDFQRVETCPYGLAESMSIHSIGTEIRSALINSKWLYNPCSAAEVDGIVPLYGVPARDVTPAMVADALERLVAVEG